MSKESKLTVLLEERQWLSNQISRYPQGYINIKSIYGQNYYYLQHREGKRVISVYVPKEQVKILARRIKMRKFLESQLRSVKQELRAIKAR